MTRATSGPVPHVDDQTLLIIDELAETADVDACVRYACGQVEVEVDLDMGNGATTSERTPATHGDKRHTQRRILPGSTIVDPVRASALVAALKAKLVDLDGATRALYNAEHVRAEKARSSQAAIELRAQEVQGSLEALRESLGRLGSDVGGSLERLEALYGGLEEVRETSAVVEGGLRTMGRVEEAMRLLSSSTSSTTKSTTTRSKGASNGELRSSSYATLYHAARLYVQSLREVKGKSSLSEPLVGSLPAVCQRVHALKPLLDARVDGLVHEFLRWQQDECAARLGRDAMAGVGIASGRYRLDPLSWAVVVTKAYGGDLGRVREVYVGQREGQLGRVLEGSLEGGFVVSGALLEAVVAFFLVEMAVAEGVGLDTVEFLKTMWDGVGAAIGAAVGAACDECDGWEEMLGMKREVLRAARALHGGVSRLETGALTSSLMKRSGQFERLVGLALVAELEQADEDVEKIGGAVRACWERVEAWMEGEDVAGAQEHGSGHDDVEKAWKRADAVISDVLSDVLERALGDSRDENIPALLSFVETVEVMLGSLLEAHSTRPPPPTTTARSKLRDVLDRAATQAGMLLAEKTFADAMEVRGADGDGADGDGADGDGADGVLLSSWCDSVIEQFEFSRDELLGEYDGPAGMQIVDAYAAELLRLVAGLDGARSRDVEAIQDALS